MRFMIAITLLIGTATAHAQDGVDDYEQHLREYDARVAEAQQWEAEQRWKRWLPLGIISGVLLVYLIYSQIAARRRYTAAMAQSQQNIEQSLKQNQEVINLLKSINERLDRDT